MVSPNPRFISSVRNQGEYFDEEILEKVNNKYYTPTEFQKALNELSTKKQNIYMHLAHICIHAQTFSALSPLKTL